MGDWRGIELSELRLTSERLDLRPFQAGDAPTVEVAMQARVMHEFLPLPDPYLASDAREYVEDLAITTRRSGTGFDSALIERSSGRLVGSASLRLPEPHSTSAEIGYSVYPEGQGHGFAAEAARRLAGWALGHSVARVVIRAAVTNLASVTSALNAGFRYETTARRDVAIRSGPADGAVFSRIADDPSGPAARAFAPLPSAGLSDGVVNLRSVRGDEGPVLLADSRDPEALRWSLTGRAFTAEEARARAERAGLDWLVGGSADLAMVDEASGRTAGILNLRKVGPPGVGGIGYSVLADWRGRGYTARALRLISGWALTVGGFSRLEVGAKAGNVASQRAALSGGFLPDGVRSGRLRNRDGTYADEVCFAVMRNIGGPAA